MQSTLCRNGAFVGAIAAFALAADARQIEIHVAPTGNDGAAGTDQGSALRTLEGARDRLRTLRSQGGERAGGGATVILHAGEYPRSSTFVLTPRDSGRAGAPVVFRAALGESVVVSGGVEPGAWEVGQKDGHAIWRAAVPRELRQSGAEGRCVRSLWVNGRRCVPARFPDRGYLQLRDVPDAPAGTSWTQGQSSFRFKDSDLAVWEKVRPGTEVVGFTRWVDTHLEVRSVDLESRRAVSTRPSMFLFQPDDWYFLEGPMFLDAPGEWSVEEDGAHLDYVPMPGETPDACRGVLPGVRELVRFAGDPANGEFVEHVEFEGIEFEYAAWWFEPGFKAAWPTPEVRGFPQAAAGVPGAIRADGARHVAFRGCTVAHVDGYAIELARGCTDCVISRCGVSDLGAGGIKIGETAIREGENERTHDNTVTDCTIADGGHLHHQAVGLWIGQSGRNHVVHNLIDGFHYTGISIGWTWGYGASLAGENSVEFNEVRNIGKRAGGTDAPLGDMGGIYTLGTQRGTVIRNNYFHDIAGRTIAWGIYLDEGSTGIVAEHNVVANTTHGGFHQHYGKENLVRNNVFLDGRDAQLWKTRREDHQAFTLERNIIVWSGGALMSGDWGGTGYAVANNVYWRRGGQPVVFPGGVDLQAWQAAGRDAGSVIADPGIDKVERGVLSGGSAGNTVGFVPIDLRGVGPRAE